MRGTFFSTSTHCKHFRVNAVSETTRQCFYTKKLPQVEESDDGESECWREKIHETTRKPTERRGERSDLTCCAKKKRENDIIRIFNNVLPLKKAL